MTYPTLPIVPPRIPDTTAVPPRLQDTTAVAPDGSRLHTQDALTTLGVLLAAALLRDGRTKITFNREEQFRAFSVSPSWQVAPDGSITVTLTPRENF